MRYIAETSFFVITVLIYRPMPKQVIISMDEKYPFGECEECNSENVRVLVRKIYQVNLQQRNKLVEKVSVLRKLKNEHMIRVESVLEEEESVHFLFEYIPIKLETWISNINDQFIESFRDQLIKFSSFLANNFIRIDFQLGNIGMDQDYRAKYFLDLSFELNPSFNRDKLKSTYIRDITNLFKPYILNKSQDIDRERQQSRQEIKITQTSKRESAISPPTNREKNNEKVKQKEKALQKYYQQVNMSVDSENQKILQEFMDVLDNEEEQQPPVKATPPPKTKAPNFSKPVQNISSGQIYTQKQLPQNRNQPVSSKQIFSTTAINSQQNYQQSSPSKQPSQNQTSFYKQAQPPKKEIQNIKVGYFTSQSMGGPNYDVKDNSQFWRSSADLQDRVKKAIEKSLDVIQKFKTIKEHYP